MSFKSSQILSIISDDVPLDIETMSEFIRQVQDHDPKLGAIAIKMFEELNYRRNVMIRIGEMIDGKII